jgi:uncharacterized protein
MGTRREQPRVIFGSQMTQATPDCDCACALTTAETVNLVDLHSGSWQIAPEVHDVPVDDQWWVCYNPLGPVPIAVLNESAQRLLYAFEAPRPMDAIVSLGWGDDGGVKQAVEDLGKTGLLCPSSFDASDVLQSGSTTLSAWLHLTDSCDLGCPYCYVRKRARHMSEPVAREIVGRLVVIALSQGYRRLRLKYGGGEPTLSAVLMPTHAYAVQKVEEAGLELEAVALTNGVSVSEEMLDFFSSHGIRVSVSLDGGPEAHNSVRRMPEGEGTYAWVTEMIDRAIAKGIQLYISITATALNLGGLEGAVRFALERNLPFNLNFYRAFSEDATASLLAPREADLVAAVEQVLEVIEGYIRSYSHPLTAILDRSRFDVPHQWACSGGRHYLAVDHHGRVAPCQMLLDQPWSHLDASQPLETIQMRGASLFVSVDEVPECRDCLWRYSCAGGCALIRGTELHERYCRAYRAIYPQLVRLEGRRLLKQGLIRFADHRGLDCAIL